MEFTNFTVLTFSTFFFDRFIHDKFHCFNFLDLFLIDLFMTNFTVLTFSTFLYDRFIHDKFHCFNFLDLFLIDLFMTNFTVLTFSTFFFYIDLFMTNVVGTAWNGIKQCWSEQVYISPLKGRFWKLTLQVRRRAASVLHVLAFRRRLFHTFFKQIFYFFSFRLLID